LYTSNVVEPFTGTAKRAATSCIRQEAWDVTDSVRHQIVALLPRLRRFSYALTGDMDSADDLLQETCARALSRLDQWQPGTRLDSWMFRIAQNIWIDRVRANKVRGVVVDLDAARDMAGEDGRQVTEGRLALGKVAKGIAQLPPDQKVLIALICVDGLSYKEAAEVLDVPIGTVMSRLARARRALFEYADGALVADATTQVKLVRKTD
jgi:RNA polymerase sigma-70 factor (ECF subfamily)